jgi:hypothetical protein
MHQVLPALFLSRPATLILSYIPFRNFVGFYLSGNLEDGLGESLDVAGGDTSDGDTTVLGSVDGVLGKLLDVVSMWFFEFK